MTIVEGIPDWQGAIEQEDFIVLPTFGGGNQYFYLPVGVNLRQKNGDHPDFSLNFICSPGYSDPEHSIYTMINMGLETRKDTMENAFIYLRKQTQQATLVSTKLSIDAFWNLEIAYQNFSPIIQPFAWENVDTARIYQRIPEEAGLLIYQILKQTNTLVASRAAVEYEIVAFVPRLPVRVRFQPCILLTKLRELNDNQSNVPYDKIYDFFVRHSSDTSLFKIEGDLDSISTRRKDFARSMTGHVRMQFGSFVPASRIADGPQIKLKEPSDTSLVSQMLWDLNTPLMAATPFMFIFDPFEKVLPVVEQEGIDAVVYFSNIPPLPNELTTKHVLIHANLPPNLQNVLAVTVTLRVESEYAPRGNAQVETRDLFPTCEEPLIVDLKFKDPNRKIYNWQVSLISENSCIENEQTDDNGDFIYVGAESIPVNFLTVMATKALLSQAELDVTLKDSNNDINVNYLLNANQPAATVVLQKNDQTVSLTIVARSLTDNTKTLNLDLLTNKSIKLDLFSFPEFGDQTINVSVNFQTTTDTAIFEFLPEGSNENPITKIFTLHSNQQQVTYRSKNLFDYRYQYRRKVSSGSTPTNWSDYQSPTSPLILTV